MSAEPLCPKCKTITLRAAGRGGTPVIRCYQCHGMWLRREDAEVLSIGEPIQDPYSMLPRKADADVGDPDAKNGLCPDGHGIMGRARVVLDDTFYVERCSTCHGMWFDAGEWQALADHRLVVELERLFDPEWQRAMRARQIEAGHRARLVTLVGAELVDALDRVTEEILAHPKGREAAGYLKQRLGL